MNEQFWKHILSCVDQSFQCATYIQSVLSLSAWKWKQNFSVYILNLPVSSINNFHIKYMKFSNEFFFTDTYLDGSYRKNFNTYWNLEKIFWSFFVGNNFPTIMCSFIHCCWESSLYVLMEKGVDSCKDTFQTVSSKEECQKAYDAIRTKEKLKFKRGLQVGE